jgi:Glycosyl transferase family 2
MLLAQVLVWLVLVKPSGTLPLGVRVHESGGAVVGWVGALALPGPLALLVGAVAAGLLVGGSWLLLQVVRQQGRLLLRIEALEARLPPDGSAAPRVPAAPGAESVPLASLPLAAPAALLPSSHGSSMQATSWQRGPVSVPSMGEEGEIELTIGMATYHDFDGVYFTLQALRLYQDLSHTELLVIDNYGCEQTQRLVEGWLKGRYLRATEVVGTAAPRELIFREARGQAVLCCDSHVLLAPGAIAQLKQYYREHPDCQDLLQGPMLYDDGKLLATHFEPRWREQMWGTWASDPRGQDPEGEPFEIPMQGLGVFSYRKAAWLGFHPGFRGFGGEEGYIHEKFRQAGRRCLCLPWLRWMHRFSRPAGVMYPLTVEDKLHNYVLGHAELGLDLAPVLEHFAQYLPKTRVLAITEQALGGPWAGSSLVFEGVCVSHT